MTVVSNPAITGVVVNPVSTGADVTVGQVSANDLTLAALATPAAPTIANIGAAGVVTWTYKVVAKIGTGASVRVTAASAGGSTTTGNATLDTTNYNTVTWAAVTGATSYDIYRTAVGTTPSTTGLIGNVLATQPLVFNDTAVAGDSSTAPTVNTTGGVNGVPTGAWTPVPTSLTVVGTPTYTGTYTRIGNRVFCDMEIASTTSTASTGGTTHFSGLPFPVAKTTVCNAEDSGAMASLGHGIVLTNGNVYTPTWAANADVVVSFSYQTT